MKNVHLCYVMVVTRTHREFVNHVVTRNTVLPRLVFRDFTTLRETCFSEPSIWFPSSQEIAGHKPTTLSAVMSDFSKFLVHQKESVDVETSENPLVERSEMWGEGRNCLIRGIFSAEEESSDCGQVRAPASRSRAGVVSSRSRI